MTSGILRYDPWPLEGSELYWSVILHCCNERQDRCITQQVRPTCFTIVQKSWKNARRDTKECLSAVWCSCVWVTAGGRVSPQAQAVFRHFHDRIKGFSRTKKVHFSLFYGRSNLCDVKRDVFSIFYPKPQLSCYSNLLKKILKRAEVKSVHSGTCVTPVWRAHSITWRKVQRGGCSLTCRKMVQPVRQQVFVTYLKCRVYRQTGCDATCPSTPHVSRP